MTPNQMPQNAKLIRAYLMVRNDLMKRGIADPLYSFVEVIRQSAIQRRGTIRGYISFMIGSHAVLPVHRCKLYGPTLNDELPLPPDVADDALLIDALARLQPDQLPILVSVPRRDREPLELAL